MNLDYLDYNLKRIFEDTIMERNVALFASNMKGLDILIRW